MEVAPLLLKVDIHLIAHHQFVVAVAHTGATGEHLVAIADVDALKASADIARDGQLLQYVREVAQTVVDADPHGMLPENEVLWRQLKALRKTNVNWAAIS